LISEDEFVLETVVFEKRVYGNIGINLRGGLVSYSQQEQENIFEVYDRDHHP
jgi:hypothetical protein